MIHFSVVIPCFNVGKYVRDTIHSVLAQKFVYDFEIILINDGSSDDTLHVINEFSNVHNIKIFNNTENKGVSYSRNRGISECKGNFVLFLDGDDYYEPDLFQELYNVVNNNSQIDLFTFSFKKKSKNSQKSYTNSKYNLCTFNKSEFLKIYFRRSLYQCMCSFAVKRDTLIKNSIFFSEDIYAGEDQEFQIKCYLNSNMIYYLSKDYFIYNYREESTMNKTFNIKRISSLKIYERVSIEISKTGLSDKLQKRFNTYSMLEFFSVLKNGLRSNNDNIIKHIIKYDTILSKDIAFDLSLQFFIVSTLRFFYRISPSIVFRILK